jgi:hypothetical protein
MENQRRLKMEKRTEKMVRTNRQNGIQDHVRDQEIVIINDVVHAQKIGIQKNERIKNVRRNVQEKDQKSAITGNVHQKIVKENVIETVIGIVNVTNVTVPEKEEIVQKKGRGEKSHGKDVKDPEKNENAVEVDPWRKGDHLDHLDVEELHQIV